MAPTSASADGPLAKKARTNESSVTAAADDEPLAKKARASDSSVAADVAAATSHEKVEGSPTTLVAASGAHTTSRVEGGGADADFTTPIKTKPISISVGAASADPKANGIQDGVGACSAVPKKANNGGRLGRDTIAKDSPALPTTTADGAQCSAWCRPPANAIQSLFRAGMLS